MDVIIPKQFVIQGIAVIPVIYREKRPALSSWEAYKRQLPSPSELSRWFSGQINYGVIMGWHDLVVMDFDDLQEYQKWLLWSWRRSTARMVANMAFKVATSRGVHVYIRVAGERNRKLGKIDIKAKGYVLGPGSVHPDGTEYRALNRELFFPRVNSLAEILPVSLLEEKKGKLIKSPGSLGATEKPVRDPWVMAMCPERGLNDRGIIEKIKRERSILSLFPEAFPTSKDRRWWVARCPFHEDHKPSLWIDTQKQICGCFAGCTEKPMDVINVFSRLYDVSNRDAIRMLTEGV